MAEGRIDFAIHDVFLVLKFVGEIRYTMGGVFGGVSALNAFLHKTLSDNSIHEVILDLTEAESIDSTNLGIMAKVTRYTREHCGHQAVIISTNHDINILLDSVGFGQVFTIVTETEVSGSGLKPLPEHHGDQKEFARLVLDAHRELAALNEQNRDAFKSVISALEGEVEGSGE